MFERAGQAEKRPSITFPKGFVWGVSTAAYQIEGAAAEGGRGPSIWDVFSHTPGCALNGDTGDIACDHYHRLEEDLDLLARLGVDVYRFSIAWPRVIPEGRGAVNAEGVGFYDRLIDGLLARGIKPVPTLYHWDFPQPLSDAGEDWTSRAVVDRFADYAQTMFEVFGDRVQTWTTLNEPWASAYLGYHLGVHAPGVSDEASAAAAHHHLLLAHGDAVARLRECRPDSEIGIALNLMHVYPVSDHPDDIEAADIADAQLNRSFLDPVIGREYPHNLGSLGRRWEQGGGLVRAGDLARISAPLDFISVNTYHPRWVCAPDRLDEARLAGYDGGHSAPLSFGLPFVDVVPGTTPKTGMGWPVHADGFRDLLLRLSRDCPGTPLYISENGFAGSDYRDQSGQSKDQDRIAYLDAHLRAVHGAIESGVDVRGYWQWSFLDNYEWSFGYSIRFGLVYVDYPTLERTPKSSFYWYRDVIANNRVPETPAGV